MILDNCLLILFFKAEYRQGPYFLMPENEF